MRRYNPNITHIVNGVTQELLDNLEPFVLAPNNRGNNKPVIIYHGATQAWRFNWKLYLSVAALCPQYEFKIYTHGKHVPTMLRFPGNVRVLEWLPPQDLCRVLEVCSLGFMPYELAEPTLSGFPLKMFEYLAAGLPVVSTRLPEVERFADCVALCDNDPGQAAALIRTAINNDSAEHRAARRSLAEKYSWPTLARQYRSGVLSRIASKVNEA
ncbi:MAG: glycosyltransferase [Patescibacteria group bacterium]